MNLFNLIPGNFFSLLSSCNCTVYFEALMLLGRFIKEELNIRTDDFISALVSLLENEAESAVFIAEKENRRTKYRRRSKSRTVFLLM